MNQQALARLDSPAALLPTPVQRAAALLAAHEPQARALGEAELAAELMDPLAGAAALLGHRNTLAHEDDLLLLAQGVAKLAQRRFPAFNLAEIREAILRGASGDYKSGRPDEILLVSLPSVGDWLAGYQRAARAAAVEASQPDPVRSLPVARIDYPAEVQTLIEAANAGKLLPHTSPDFDFGSLLYDWLKSIGAFTGWRPADYYADLQAEEAERVAVLAQDNRTSTAGRMEYNTFMAALSLGKLAENHPLSRSVTNACRKRVLREWLMECLANETDVLALLAELQAKQAA